MELPDAGRSNGLREEWQRFSQCASFLSFRIRVEGMPLWGTLTMAHQRPHYFQEHIWRSAFEQMRVFVSNVRLGVLTNVCRSIYEMKTGSSLSDVVRGLHRLYCTTVPVISVSVALCKAQNERAAMFIDRRQIPSHQETELEERHVRMDSSMVLMQLKSVEEGDQPLPVTVPSLRENPLGLIAADVQMLLSGNHRLQRTTFLVLPLRKAPPPAPPPPPLPVQSHPPSWPQQRSLYLQPPSQSSSGFIGAVYLRLTHPRILRQIQGLMHSLSSVIAGVLESRIDQLFSPVEATAPSPVKTAAAAPVELSLPGLASTEQTSTETTRKIVAIMKEWNQAREQNWKREESMSDSVKIDRLVSTTSSFGIVMKGTWSNQTVGIKVLLAQRELEGRPDLSRVRLELAICRCLSHPHVITSLDQYTDVTSERIMLCCPSCTCSLDRASECCHHTVSMSLKNRAAARHPRPKVIRWDVMLMCFCSRGTLQSLIHEGRSHVFYGC